MRARQIKPSFYTNESLADCSLDSQKLFTGLWCFADREGRFEWRLRKIQAEIFPYGLKRDIEKVMEELTAKGFVVRYEAAGHAYGFIPTFKKHQYIHPKEAESKLPKPPDQLLPDQFGNFPNTFGDEVPCTKQEQEQELEQEGGSPEGGRVIELAPRIRVSLEEKLVLESEFGAAAVAHYAPICSDWLFANGKTKKDYRAFMANWIRKEIAECSGFYSRRSATAKQTTIESLKEKYRGQ